LPVEDVRDVVIVGGGAAGVSCALECFDLQLDTLVFESDGHAGGQLDEIPHSIRNVAATHFVDGPAMRRGLENSAAILGDRLRLAQPVTRVDLAERRVEVLDAAVDTRAIVLTTGTSRQQIPGAVDGAFGGDVTYQLDADRERFAGRDVVVIGGGDSATLDALELASAGSAVTLVHRSDALTARDDIVEQVRREPRIHELAGWELGSLRGGERLEEVVLQRADGQRVHVPAGGLVVKIARVPRTQLVHGQVELDRHGAIVVDGELRTSRAGVMAAGDVVAGAYARIATAVGQGVLAARSVLRYVEGRT